MFSRKPIFTVIGIAILSFGLGSLLSLFLPTCVLVVIQAILITGAGVFYILQKR